MHNAGARALSLAILLSEAERVRVREWLDCPPDGVLVVLTSTRSLDLPVKEPMVPVYLSGKAEYSGDGDFPAVLHRWLGERPPCVGLDITEPDDDGMLVEFIVRRRIEGTR